MTIINVGESRGRATTSQRSVRLMDESGIRFVGNVEGRDIPGGVADVLVTDGLRATSSSRRPRGWRVRSWAWFAPR